MITTKVTRDGEVLAELEDEDSPFVWLLKHQGQSVYYALRWGGYSVTDAEGKELPWVDDYRRH